MGRGPADAVHSARPEHKPFSASITDAACPAAAASGGPGKPARPPADHQQHRQTRNVPFPGYPVCSTLIASKSECGTARPRQELCRSGGCEWRLHSTSAIMALQAGSCGSGRDCRVSFEADLHRADGVFRWATYLTAFTSSGLTSSPLSTRGRRRLDHHPCFTCRQRPRFSPNFLLKSAGKRGRAARQDWSGSASFR